jgi:hypothetical protein
MLVYVGQAFLGFALGYLIASYIESFLHEHVSDAPATRVAQWSRYPRLFRSLIKTRFSHHVVHHHLTFRADYVTQFSSEEERLRLYKTLKARGRHGDIILRGNYANHLHAEGAVVFALPFILVGLLALWVVPMSFAAGLLPSLALPPLFSYFVHPYLHMPTDRAERDAPRAIAMLLRTPYARALRINHFLHHEYHGTSNFNLVLGADVLRRKARVMTESDLAKMRKLGVA